MTNIPQQKIGGFNDTVSEIILESENTAIQHFETVKKRFLDVNSWEHFSGKEKAEFCLCNDKAEILLRNPQQNDFLRIKMPAPKNETGESFDWLIFEEVSTEKDENSETIYLRVRPCACPTKNSDEIAHFFKDSATNNFLIKRTGDKIVAEIHGRNEIPNTEISDFSDKVRNTFVAFGGFFGGSKVQWKSLTDALIEL